MMSAINRLRRIALWTIFLAAVGNGVCAEVKLSDVLSKTHRRTPVNARLVVPREGAAEETTTLAVTLLGRDGDVLLAQDARQGQRLTRIHKATVLRCDFELEHDSSAVAAAVLSSNWAAAVRILSPVVRLALPYLDVPENNAVELVMDLGLYMVASADREMRLVRKGRGERERANAQYDAAHQLFLEAGKAEWTPFGRVALLKSCRALTARGRSADAVKMLGEINEPFTDDVAYGQYWLAQAEMLAGEGRTLDALHAAVKSVVFANKDAETFPAALLLTADCYVGIDQFYRARDIYYEVAVLFIGTDWEIDALEGLKKVMESRKTVEAEKSDIENVFFNVDEDMNKLSEELLKKRAEKLAGAASADEKRE